MFSLVLATIVYAQEYLPATPVASGRSCAPADYRANLPPAKTQGDTGFCYAYTSADLINQRVGANVSALDLAMAFYFTDAAELRGSREPALREYLDAHPRFENEIRHDRVREDVTIEGPHPFFHHIEGGFELPALLLANVRGLCADHHLPSDGGFDAHMAVISALEKRARRGAGTVGREVSRFHPRFRDPAADLFHTEWSRWVNARCEHEAPPLALVPVEFAIADSSSDFLFKRTEGRVDDGDSENVFRVIDYALDHGRIAAIGLDLNTLLKAAEDADDGDHSVTVVGRRPTSRECEYLVRDSSGYDCEDYLEGLGQRCADRHVWVKESELRRSLYSVTYLR